MSFDLERDIERMIAREESKRLKAYKYMQALSHQIELLTKRTLPSYVPDEEWVSLVKPLQSPCHRMASCDFIDINNERLNPLTACAGVAYGPGDRWRGCMLIHEGQSHHGFK